MRLFFTLFVLLIIFMFGSRIVSLLFSGQLFQEGAMKKIMGESGKNLWWGMKMFVVIWLLYLTFIFFVRKAG